MNASPGIPPGGPRRAAGSADRHLGPRGPTSTGEGGQPSGQFGERSLALFADLYELTMAQAYIAENMTGKAVFEIFFRQLPGSRAFVMAAGLPAVLDYLESFAFSEADLAYLATLGKFREDFLDHLGRLRFTGDVWAVPEGTLVFPNEPIIQVVAPIVEAQLVETYILNRIHFGCVAATKAARVVLAARGRLVVEFGSRRAHAEDAALEVARCAYLAGAAGTSNVLAGRLYGIPVFGTMAHSYVQAHATERAAFEAFARLYPGTTLLVDTYDTLAGTRLAADVARALGPGRVAAIRIDSGDLLTLSMAARRILDDAGLRDIRIFASSGLDEYEIDRLLQAGAPIDAFGVGTRMAVSRDVPDFDMAYKLVDYEGQSRLKLSEGKVILPGRKQVFRTFENGVMQYDTIAPFDEERQGTPLLVPVMVGGRRLPAGSGDLEAARRRAADELARLPAPLKAPIPSGSPYPVHLSERLQAELERLRRTHEGGLELLPQSSPHLQPAVPDQANSSAR